MNEDEVESLYELLAKKYLPPETNEEKLPHKKTLSNADNVESIHMEENE